MAVRVLRSVYSFENNSIFKYYSIGDYFLWTVLVLSFLLNQTKKILHSKLSWWNLTRRVLPIVLPLTKKPQHSYWETNQHHFPGCCCGPTFSPYFHKTRKREINKCWVDTIRRRVVLKISAANLVNYEGFLVDSKQREGSTATLTEY